MAGNRGQLNHTDEGRERLIAEMLRIESRIQRAALEMAKAETPQARLRAEGAYRLAVQEREWI